MDLLWLYYNFLFLDFICIDFEITLDNLVVDYTELATSTVTQRQSIHYTGSPQLLYFYLVQLAGELQHIETDQEKKDAPVLHVKAFEAITVQLIPPVCTLEVV